jgi:hypothetical protein
MTDYRSLIDQIQKQEDVTMRGEPEKIILDDRKRYGYLSFLQREFPSSTIYLAQPDLVIIAHAQPIIERSKYRFIQYLTPDDLASKMEKIDRSSPVLLLDPGYDDKIDQLGFRRLNPAETGDIRINGHEYALLPARVVKSKDEIILRIQRNFLQKGKFVYGPNYLSILISPEQTLILFGEEHLPYGEKCSSMKGEEMDLSIEDYLGYLLDDNPKDFFDFYMEENYWQFFIEGLTEGKVTNSEASGRLFNTFKDCLILSRRDKYCPYPNLQTHFADLRFRSGIAELNANTTYFIITYPQLEGKTIDDPQVKRIVDIYSFNSILTDAQAELKEFEGGTNKYLELFLPIIQAEIDTIAPPFAKEMKKLQERLDKLRIYFTTEYPNEAAKFIEKMRPVIQSIAEGGKINLKELGMAKLPFSGFSNRAVELMDLYALARMMHRFNMAKRKENGGLLPKNVIFYGGVGHTRGYRNFFVGTGYQEIYLFERPYIKESQCIRVPDYPELQSWLKPIVEPILTPAQIEYYARPDVPYQETEKALISTKLYWDPVFWARKAGVEVSQFQPPITSSYPNERFIELQLSSGKITGDLAAKFIEEKGYVFPGIENIQLRGPKSESKYLEIPGLPILSPPHPYVDLLLAQKGDYKLIEHLKGYLDDEDYFAITSLAMLLDRLDLFALLLNRMKMGNVDDLYHVSVSTIHGTGDINLCRDEDCRTSVQTIKLPDPQDRNLVVTKILLERKLIDPVTVINELLKLRYHPGKETIRWLFDQGYLSRAIEASREEPYLPGPKVFGEFIYAVLSPKTNLSPDERRAWFDFIIKETKRTDQTFFVIIDAIKFAREHGDEENAKILEPYKWS